MAGTFRAQALNDTQKSLIELGGEPLPPVLRQFPGSIKQVLEKYTQLDENECDIVAAAATFLTLHPEVTQFKALPANIEGYPPFVQTAVNEFINTPAGESYYAHSVALAMVAQAAMIVITPTLQAEYKQMLTDDDFSDLSIGDLRKMSRIVKEGLQTFEKEARDLLDGRHYPLADAARDATNTLRDLILQANDRINDALPPEYRDPAVQSSKPRAKKTLKPGQ